MHRMHYRNHGKVRKRKKILILARVLYEHEDLVICDLAETYGILEYRELKGRTLANLVCGLRPSSRLMQTLNNQRVTTEELLLASAVDALNMLVWSKTKDATTGKNRPASIVQNLTQAEEPKAEGYDTIEEFERARASIIERSKECRKQ